MTNSLPDIYKHTNVSEDEETVLIPDFHRPYSPLVSEESEGDPSSEEAGDGPRMEEYYTRQELEAQVSQEVERIRGKMREQVYRDAAAEKEQEIRDCLRKVDATLQEIDEEHRQFMEEYRNHLTGAAIDIAEKVILRKIEEDDLYLSELVTHAVSSMKNADWITVGVSNKLTELVEFLRKELKRGDYGNAELAAGAYPKDACLVETSDGMVDASVSEQFRNMRNELDSMEERA